MYNMSIKMMIILFFFFLAVAISTPVIVGLIGLKLIAMFGGL